MLKLNIFLLVWLLLFLFLASVVSAQDTFPSEESGLPQSLNSMSTEELWTSALTLLAEMSNSSENISSELTNLSELELTESNILLILNELGMSEDEVLRFLKMRMTLSEEEWTAFLEYWQNLKDGTIPSHETMVHRRWRTASIVEALFIIGGIILIIFL
jgi:hypothetical protein